MITIGVAIGVALLIAVVTRLAAVNVIKVNGLVGLRTRRTMASQAAWQRGHEAAFPLTIVTVVVTSIVGVAILLIAKGEARDGLGLIATASTVVGAIGAAVRANNSLR